MIALLLALAAAGEPYLDFRVDEPLEVRKARFDGELVAPPASDWVVRLPARINAATHTERARPVIVGDEILVGCAGGRGLYRFSRTNGDLLGVFETQGAVESEPLLDDGTLWFGDTGGFAWRFDLDGTQRWSADVGAPIIARPTLAGDVVIFTTVDDLAVALDVESGDVVWRYRRKVEIGRRGDLALYGSPSATVVGGVAVVGFSDGAVVALAVDDGRVAWDRQVGEGTYPDVLAPAGAHGKDVFASAYFQPLVAIDQNTKNVRWRVEAGAADAMAIVDEGGEVLLLHPGTDGVLRAIVANTGDERWRWESGTDGALTAPVPTRAGILIGSSEAGLYLVDPATGAVRWELDLGFRLVGLSAAPAVSGRQVVFTTNAGELVSLVQPRRVAPWARRKLGDAPVDRQRQDAAASPGEP